MKRSFMVTKRDARPTNRKPDKLKKIDLSFRIALICMFGMGAVGFVLRRRLAAGQVVFGCIYAITSIVFLLEGNRYLWKLISTKLEWHRGPVKRIVTMLFSIVVYTFLLGLAVSKGWELAFGAGIVTDDQAELIIALMIFWEIIITHFYETAFLVRQSANDTIKKEQGERLSVEAELELLKSQIDPHFMFNSLNTLSHLITVDPLRAQTFNDSLADVYRYILLNKDRKLVSLQEEVTFLKDYLCLLKIRFESAIVFNINIEEEVLKNYLIPPISLQVLLENAVKHNEFNTESPLIINLKKVADALVMSNRVVIKIQCKPSSGIGLTNLKERYRHLTGISPEIFQENGYFSVNLPIIKLRN